MLSFFVLKINLLKPQARAAHGFCGDAIELT